MTDSFEFLLSHNSVTVKLSKNYNDLGEKKLSLIFYLYICCSFNVCTNNLE